MSAQTKVEVTRGVFDPRTYKQVKVVESWGGGYVCPQPRICVYLCKYTYERVEKNLTFLNYKFGKGRYAFYPIKLFRFAKK